LNSKFKVWCGLEDDIGNIEWFSQGVYLLENPTIVSDFSNSKIQLKGSDKFSSFSNGRGSLNATYIIPINTNITDAVQSILNLIGDKTPPIFHSSLLNKKIPYTITKESSSKLSDLLLELATIYSSNIFYNSDGVLVMEPDLENSVKSSVWDYNQDSFQYLGGSLEHKWDEISNSCKVVGSNVNGATYSSISYNNNLDSDISIPNLGYEMCYLHTSDLLDSNIKCSDLSAFILKRLTAKQSEISINSIPMYHISNSDSDVITITDFNLKLNKERYLVSSLSIPLSFGGNMSLKCIKEKELVVS